MRVFPANIAVFAFFAMRASAHAALPLNYLTSDGPKADDVVGLTWAMMIVSIVVVTIISGLLVWAIWRRPGLPPQQPGDRLAVDGHEGGLSWIWVGVSLSSVVLLASVVWTVAVLAEITNPPTKPKLTIEITARQWWWQARYESADPARIFTTANEIHIPTGEPVLLRLVGGDVIHSFWVPALSGKTDVIPGQTNEIWLQAKHSGIYRGQCTEYCGMEHARMGFLVIAETPGDFERWWHTQLLSPAVPGDPRAKAGMLAFGAHCGACHAVRGTDASGVLGPDLSHLMQRHTLAAATIANDDAGLTNLIRDPQGVKPGILMQPPQLSAGELADITLYLKTLR